MALLKGDARALSTPRIWALNMSTTLESSVIFRFMVSEAHCM